MSIIAKYSLNGNANDSAGSNNGTATNVSWVNSKMNWWASFNGSNSSINIGTFLNSITWTFSINCIVNMNSFWSLSSIFIKWNDSPSAWRGFYLYCTNTWQIGVSVITTSPWIAQYDSPTVWITTNRNYVIYWYYNSSTQKVWLYVDWKFIWETSTWTVLRSNNGSFFWNTSYWAYLNWKLDEVELYNTALTPTQIKNKYLYYNWFM